MDLSKALSNITFNWLVVLENDVRNMANFFQSAQNWDFDGIF